MKNWLEKNRFHIIISLMIGCIVLISQAILKQYIDKTILQYLSMIDDNSWFVQIHLIVLVGLIYGYAVMKSKSLYSSKVLFPSRLIWLLLLLLIFSFFRIKYSSSYIWYGIGDFKMRYIDLAMLFLCVIEVVLLCYRIRVNWKGKDNTQLQTIKNYFKADVPSEEDGFNRKSYADSLWDLIWSTFIKKEVLNAAFTILLNEKYGWGKSSFFHVVRKSINDQAHIIDFKPWPCSDETQTINELIDQLISANVIDDNKLLIKYANTLANYESWVGIISRIFTSSQITSLNNQYDAIKEKMKMISKPVVVFVDDVDRLADKELMELLKLIRNTADFPNMFYIIAADKQYLCSTILRTGVKEANIYLQKFFNFEMTFPKDDKRNDELLKDTLKIVLSPYNLEKKGDNFINDFCNLKYMQFMLQTPRDIYRYCNMLTFDLELFKKNDLTYGTHLLNELHYPDLMVLTLLHYVSADIYKLLRDRDEYILTMKSNNRLHLNENYQDIIGKMYSTEEIVEVIVDKNIQKKRNVCKTIDEATMKTLPETDMLIASLLERLFPNRNNVSQYSIALVGEYYKYFAGRCAKTEMTGAEVHNLISLTHIAFESKICEIIKNKKYEHFKVKLSNYFLNETISTINILYNLSCIWQYEKEMNSDKLINHSTLFEMKMQQYVYNIFFFRYDENSQTRKVVSNIMKGWINREPDLEFVALLLNVLIHRTHDEIILSKDILHFCCDNIVNRFIEEQISNDPFAQRVVEQYYSFGMLTHQHWYSKLQKYIKDSSLEDQMKWIYNIIINEKNIWRWNNNLIKGINSIYGSNLDSYFALLGISIPQNLKNSMENLNLGISVEEQKNNPFMQILIGYRISLN